MTNLHSFKGGFVMFRFVVTTICLAFSLSTSALAAKPPSNEQLFEMVKALQSRVAVLEKQNGKYQRELISVQRDAEQPQLASLTRSADEPKPMRLAIPTGEALQPADNWSGMYWGTSFGAGFTKPKHSSTTTFLNATTVAKASDTKSGAVMDLFLGWNTKVRQQLVAGLQVEGSISPLNFNADASFTSSTGPTGVHTVEVEAQWMASALARVGWLIRPDTVLYGLAGLTFAHFDTGRAFTEIRGFDADGLSVGAGIEKKFGPDWSLRAEYRCTDFGEADEIGIDVFNPPEITANRFENKMHIGRIGIVRKFGRSEPSAEALK